MFHSLASAPASLTTTVMATTAFRCPSYYGCSISSQWLDEIVSAKIAEIATNASVSPDSGCLLSDMGDFLVRASASLARLAEGVVHGPHIDVYVEKRIKEMEQEHDFSELGALDYIDEKHSSLKAISTSLANAAALTARTWAQNTQMPKPGSHLNKRSPHESMSDTHMSSSTSVGQASNLDPAEDDHSAGDSPGSANLKQYVVDDLLTTLATRGKGTYVCPYGYDCKKGGVKLDGGLVTFERNSSFRAHLQKHEKLYKCDIPGCKNKKGFARIDQLKRHKQVVAHG